MRFLADENFHGAILRGLLRAYPKLDVVRVQDTEVYQAEDPKVLAWAADQNRILLSHDVSTLSPSAYARVSEGLSMPGVILIPDDVPIGQAINDLSIVIDVGYSDDFENKVIHLPL